MMVLFGTFPVAGTLSQTASAAGEFAHDAAKHGLANGWHSGYD
jgi:hypothetical protein